MTSARLGSFLRQRFMRVTSSVAYIPQLDGLRSLALLLIIGHHIFALYLEQTHRLGTQSLPRDWGLIYSRSPLVPWGLNLAFGVQIFFAISGFVLALPFARTVLDRSNLPSIKLYLLRRLVRLEPPYFLNMTFLFLFVLHPWGGTPHWLSMVNFKVFGPHYLASIVYMHGLIYGTPSWLGGIAWTLEIEIQFYLFMPALALLFKLRNAVVRRMIFLALTIAAALFAQYTVPHLANPRWALSLIGNLEFFLSGVLLADIYLDPPRMLRFRARISDLVAGVGMALLIYVLHYQPSLAWIEPFLVVVFYFGVFGRGWVGRFFSHPTLTIPGTMCYTIYLYHFFLAEHWLHFTLRYFPAQHALLLDTVLQMLSFLPVMLIICAVLYLGIERPFVILSHKATRRWRPAAHPAHAPVEAKI